MKKDYGICKILGQANFEVLVEFNSTYSGRDIITGTKLKLIKSRTCGCDMSGSVEVSPETILEAAKDNQIKNNTLLIEDYSNVTRDEILEYLKSMSEEDIAKYTKTIEDLKMMYKDTKRYLILEKIDRIVRKKKNNKEFESEKQRVKSLSKNLDIRR